MADPGRRDLARRAREAARYRRLRSALSYPEQLRQLRRWQGTTAASSSVFLVTGCAFWGWGYGALGRAYLWAALLVALGLVVAAGRSLAVERRQRRLDDAITENLERVFPRFARGRGE